MEWSFQAEVIIYEDFGRLAKLRINFISSSLTESSIIPIWNNSFDR